MKKGGGGVKGNGKNMASRSDRKRERGVRDRKGERERQIERHTDRQRRGGGGGGGAGMFR